MDYQFQRLYLSVPAQTIPINYFQNILLKGANLDYEFPL